MEEGAYNLKVPMDDQGIDTVISGHGDGASRCPCCSPNSEVVLLHTLENERQWVLGEWSILQ